MNPPLNVSEAAEAAGGRIVSCEPTATIARFAVDTRHLSEGDWFAALPGETRDGHEFSAEAVRRGAAGLLVSREENLPDVPRIVVKDCLESLQKIAAFHRGRVSAKIVAVTGSNGKTTTKEMLAHVLAESGDPVFATRGNMNSQIGLPLMLLELEPRHGFAVLEMGASGPGHIARLASLARPHFGVITNVGLAHVGLFGGPERVLEAKWELAASLPPEGVAVLNGDDPRLVAKAKELKTPRILFGTSKGLDVRAENIRQEPEAVFDLRVGNLIEEVRLPLPGVFNVMNALAAAAVAIFAGVSFSKVARSLSRFTPPPQRMQARTGPSGSLFVLDAYNANPSSMEASLDSFVRAYPSHKKIAVLGGMHELGEFSREEHKKLGRRLAELPLDSVHFLGTEGEWVREGFLGAGGRVPLNLAQTPESITAALNSSMDSHTAVLFKASRGVRLERVYDSLLR